jgi:hypothetical protein
MPSLASLTYLPVHPALAVAVADVDVAVGADRDARGLVLALRLVDAGLFGERDRQQHLAVERQLEHLASAEAAEPEDFLVPFLGDLHAVGAAELLAPALHEGAVLLEDEHGVVGVRVEVDAVLRVDVRVAVGGAHVLHALGQLRPVLDPLVLVDAVPEDDLVLGHALGEEPAREQRGGGSGHAEQPHHVPARIFLHGPSSYGLVFIRRSPVYCSRNQTQEIRAPDHLPVSEASGIRHQGAGKTGSALMPNAGDPASGS